MTKLSKESILPLASMLTGTDYNEGLKRAMEHLDWDESMYGVSTPTKKPLTKKQTKARAKAKAARKARKRK